MSFEKIMSSSPLERAAHWAMEAEMLYRNQYEYDDLTEWRAVLADTALMASMWADIAQAGATAYDKEYGWHSNISQITNMLPKEN